MRLDGRRRRSSGPVDSSRKRRIQRGGFSRGLQGKREGEVVGIFFFTKISHCVSNSVIFSSPTHLHAQKNWDESVVQGETKEPAYGNFHAM